VAAVADPLDSDTDLPVTVDEEEVVSGTAETLVGPIVVPDEARGDGEAEDEDSDVVIGDDLAVMIDAEVDAEEADAAEAKKPTDSTPPAGGKRSIPPPLPRA
jgi:hypothetical protein